MSQRIEPALLWDGSAFVESMAVVIDDAGRIAAVEPSTGQGEQWPDKALMPGFVNAHSHVFQRAMRGDGERFVEGVGSFWTWREHMYDLVCSMDEQYLYELAVETYREMRACGMTTVGEFHYLHHVDGQRRFEFDQVILDAAAAAGIRVVLLNAYYVSGAIGEPLSQKQQRFDGCDSETFWKQMDLLSKRVEGQSQAHLGAVIHSIRAAGDLTEMAKVAREAQVRGMVLHMHVEEQPAEIAASLEAYGRTPMSILMELAGVGPRFTAVHCTHTAERDMDDFLQAGGTVCICPLTEANLGDGLANIPFILRHGGRICLGSDSNARIDMLEEMRLLEYGQRLLNQGRGIIRDQQGQMAPLLMQAATLNGAHSLGLPAGVIKQGRLADLACINLRHKQLAHIDRANLAEAMVIGCDGSVVSSTCVHGIWSSEDSI
jgi:formimidoylglutamate deiminase